MDILSHMEFLVCVDTCCGAWSIFSRLLEDDICSAITISVAVRVRAFATSALVSSSPPSILIRFHDVKLRASVSTNIGSIAVLEGIAVVR